MTSVVHAFEYLKEKSKKLDVPMIVVFGTDPFLRFHALQKTLALAGVDHDAVQSYEGPECHWRDVHDELATLSLFDATNQRIALVRDADKFVTANRPSLERWLESPPADALLLLECTSFVATTKLYKQVAARGWLIQCSPPVTAGFGNPIDEPAIQRWMITWALDRHRLHLETKQATIILDRAGTEIGMLDGELAKLALFADEQGRISDQQIVEMVGGWRTQTLWKIAELIASGKAADAIEQQDRLFTSGQNAIGIFAPLSWSLRRFGVAAHLIEQADRVGQKLPLPTALEKAGFRKGEIRLAETQLRRIGRQRGKQLLGWLLQLETKLKGSHSNESLAKFALEEFILKLA